MQKAKKTFNELTIDAADVLKHKLQRAAGTVKWYKHGWKKLGKYMSKHGIQYFTPTIGKNYLLEQFGDLEYIQLPKKDKDVIKIVSVLSEFYKTGTLTAAKERIVFNGPIGEHMKSYSAHLLIYRLNRIHPVPLKKAKELVQVLLVFFNGVSVESSHQ